MALNIFKKPKPEEEKTEVDKAIEERRKEKFAKPLSVGDDFDETMNEIEKAIVDTQKTIEAQPAVKPVVKPAVKPVVKQTAKPAEPVKVPRAGTTSSGYRMSEVISPMFGRQADSKAEEKRSSSEPRKKVTQKPIEDQLVPIISPMFGTAVQKEEEVEKEVVKPTRRSRRKQIIEQPQNETEELRNIANIIQEEEDTLRLIEKRTGEFQLDFSNMKQEPTLIDEVGEQMTLDELLSLYQKKNEDEE